MQSTLDELLVELDVPPGTGERDEQLGDNLMFVVVVVVVVPKLGTFPMPLGLPPPPPLVAGRFRI